MSAESEIRNISVKYKYTSVSIVSINFISYLVGLSDLQMAHFLIQAR